MWDLGLGVYKMVGPAHARNRRGVALRCHVQPANGIFTTEHTEHTEGGAE